MDGYKNITHRIQSPHRTPRGWAYPQYLEIMNPIDTYLTSVPSEYRAALEKLRGQIRVILPDSEECLSYGMPAFKVG